MKPVTDTKKEISTLNKLIEICKDGQKGFQTASEHVQDIPLMQLCTQASQERGQFADELQQLVRQLGGNPDETGSVAGTLHRGWMNLKTAIATHEDEAIIAECERGEDIAKAAYEEALKEYESGDVQTVIQNQYLRVKAVHDQFRALEKAA